MKLNTETFNAKVEQARKTFTEKRAAPNTSSNVRSRPASPMGRKLSPGAEPFLYCLTIFIPPIPVYICNGIGADFYLNCILFLFGFIPAVVHACFIIHQHANARANANNYTVQTYTRPLSRSSTPPAPASVAATQTRFDRLATPIDNVSAWTHSISQSPSPSLARENETASPFEDPIEIPKGTSIRQRTASRQSSVHSHMTRPAPCIITSSPRSMYNPKVTPWAPTDLSETVAEEKSTEAEKETHQERTDLTTPAPPYSPLRATMAPAASQRKVDRVASLKKSVPPA